MSDKRYVINVQFSMWEEDDLKVIERAKEFEKEFRDQNDNDASVTEIIEQPFGTFNNRKVL